MATTAARTSAVERFIESIQPAGASYASTKQPDVPRRTNTANRAGRCSNRPSLSGRTVAYRKAAPRDRLLAQVPEAGAAKPLHCGVGAEMEAETLKVMADGLADSTRTKYASGLESFLAFCDSKHIPSRMRIPADEFLLCTFAASKAGSHARQTVQNTISALRAWHIFHNAQWNGGPRLQYVLSGIAKRAPPSQPPRPPVTREMLNALHEHLPTSSPMNACILAAADVAFWTQCRLGELLSARTGTFNSDLIPLRQHLGLPSTRQGSRGLHLPWTKTKKSQGDDTVVLRQRGPCDPVAALDRHLRLNNVPRKSPLFSYRHGAGWRYLTKQQLVRACNTVWSKAGHAHVPGHSFRIGGTTELLASGVNPLVVKKMGRWSSDAFLRYWRMLETVIPLHAEALRPRVASLLERDSARRIRPAQRRAAQQA